MASAPDDREVTVREFSLEDYDGVVGLWTAAGLSFRPNGRDRRDRVAAELERGVAVFLVAESAGRLVGTVLGTHDGRKGWINRLAVAPDCRRRGIGRLLVEEVEARLEALGPEITAAPQPPFRMGDQLSRPRSTASSQTRGKSRSQTLQMP